MWIIQSNYSSDHFYQDLEKELCSLIEGEKNLYANLANISSWVYHTIPDMNWCGFYLWSETDKELVLGPFQGKPACIRIKPERGVCGSAYSTSKTQLVDDVHLFAGHISCDSVSRSELVIPLIKKNTVVGVLDLDSPHVSRFKKRDAENLEKIFNKISELIF
jgi:L-methionine (R)-S-oxide reductase